CCCAHHRSIRRTRSAVNCSGTTLATVKPQNVVSQSNTSQSAVCPATFDAPVRCPDTVTVCADNIGGFFHHSEVHARQILADDPQREQLGASKNGDDRGEKTKPRHYRALYPVTPHDVQE